MENGTRSKSKKTIIKFTKKDEKEILMLYEALGKDICKKYSFDYIGLLETMVARELKRKESD